MTAIQWAKAAAAVALALSVGACGDDAPEQAAAPPPPAVEVAKPVVKERADTAISVPYLDAILFTMGIRRQHVEEADAADPDFDAGTRIEVPGTPPI